MSPADDFKQRLQRLTVAATELRVAGADFSEWMMKNVPPRGTLLRSEASALTRVVESLDTVERLSSVIEAISCASSRVTIVSMVILVGATVAHGKARTVDAFKAGVAGAIADCPCGDCVAKRRAGVDAAAAIAKAACTPPSSGGSL